MEGIRTVHSAVHKASRVSKREGKWSNLQEIKRKIPHETTFKQPVRPLLNKLVKNSDIEKKSRASLWRPDDAGAAGRGSSLRRSSPKTGDRRSSPKPSGRRSSPKTGRRSTPKTGGRRDLARTVARGAVGGAVGSSVRSTVARIMF